MADRSPDRPPWPRSVRPTRVLVRVPEPEQGQLNFTLKAACPAPYHHTSDEYRCRRCGVVWGVDEPRPPCHST
jgi:hypothetical protein